MSKTVIGNREISNPRGTLAWNIIAAHIDPIESHQATAADNTATFIVSRPGVWLAAFAMLSGTIFTGTEHMTVDLQNQGTSMLLAATPLDLIAGNVAGTEYAFTPLATTPVLAAGNKVTVIRDYTAGNGSAATANVVKFLWGCDNYDFIA